jgi:hypothetical protein
MREDLRSFPRQAGPACHMELMLRDNFTGRYQPKRLWEWAALTMEVAEDPAR